MFYGDRNPGDRIDWDISFVNTSGVPTALTSGSAFCRQLPTQTIAPAGVLLTASGGLNMVTVFTASASSFYAAGFDYSVITATGNISGNGVQDLVLGQFSIQNRNFLRPTTGGRTLNVSAGGVGDANVATWLAVAPNALLSGRVDANAAAVTVSSNVLTWLGSTPNALLSGRVDANAAAVTVSAAVLTMATGSIAAATFAAGAIDAAALAASAGQEIADAILLRDLATGASATDRNVQNALRALRNRTAISGTTLTVYEEDDSTSAWTAVVTTSSSLDPISQVNPA